MQKKQNDWKWQWDHYRHTGEWLFKDWIYPNKIDDFKDKSVVDCGCGSGDHLLVLSHMIKEGVGIDLNASSCAAKNFRGVRNLRSVEGDLANVSLPKKFDIVYSIGVLHHTDNPTKSFNNIKRLGKRGSRVIVWVYSKEGNFLNRTLLEWLKSNFFLKMSKKSLNSWGKFITAMVYVPVYTIYLVPLFDFLPFYKYFKNWRKMDFNRNLLNVFDKLNAPTTHFIDRKTISSWFNSREFKDVHLSRYVGVSWRGSGTLK